MTRKTITWYMKTAIAVVYFPDKSSITQRSCWTRYSKCSGCFAYALEIKRGIPHSLHLYRNLLDHIDCLHELMTKLILSYKSCFVAGCRLVLRNVSIKIGSVIHLYIWLCLYALEIFKTRVFVGAKI